MSLESNEFVIHVLDDYDYRYSSEEYREAILYYVVAAYFNVSHLLFFLFGGRDVVFK